MRSHYQLACTTAALVFAATSSAQVQSEGKLSATSGAPVTGLSAGDFFGVGLTCLGDVNGDGIPDLAAGASNDSDGAPKTGAVWILFMNADGTVGGQQKLSALHGGIPTGTLAGGDLFGLEVDGIGDLNADRVPDLVAGSELSQGAHGVEGAIFILLLDKCGIAQTTVKISNPEGEPDRFGASIAAVGDLDDNGTVDLAVGAYQDDDGGTNHGAVHILFFNPDWTLAGSQKISSTAGNFVGPLSQDDKFGADLARLDVDGRKCSTKGCRAELAVTATGDSQVATSHGCVWILHLGSDGMVLAEQKITDNVPGFQGVLKSTDAFGTEVEPLHADDDGNIDLLVTAPKDDAGGQDQGAAWILFLADDYTVRGHHKVSALDGGFSGPLDPDDRFGEAAAAIGDLDGNGTCDIAIGAINDDDGGAGLGANFGAVWLLYLGCMQMGEQESRLGSPPNPDVLRPDPSGPPVLGDAWEPFVDHSSFAPFALFDALLISQGEINLPTPLGTLLCAIPASPIVEVTAPGNRFQVVVPQDCSFLGVELCTQAASLEAGGALFVTNAMDILIGSF